MTDHPAPLVSSEISLRGLPWMRLDTERLLNSDLFALASGDEFKAAVALWCKSWSQEPAGSLPANDRILATLSGAGPRWPKVKALALHGWFECSDGRLYHRVVAEQVHAAWDERVAHVERLDGQNERKRKEREKRSAIFAELKAHGITPEWNTKTSVLAEMLDNLSPAGHASGHSDSHGVDGTGRDGTLLTTNNPRADRTLEGPSATLARALVEMGFQGASPDGALIQEAATLGVTAAELQAIAREKPGKPLAYILRTAIGRKRDDGAGTGVNGSSPSTLDPAAKAMAAAKHDFDSAMIDARELHNHGHIDGAERTRREDAAKAKYQAATSQEARA